jgi:hypothetical protein
MQPFNLEDLDVAASTVELNAPDFWLELISRDRFKQYLPNEKIAILEKYFLRTDHERELFGAMMATSIKKLGRAELPNAIEQLGVQLLANIETFYTGLTEREFSPTEVQALIHQIQLRPGLWERIKKSGPIMGDELDRRDELSSQTKEVVEAVNALEFLTPREKINQLYINLMRSAYKQAYIEGGHRQY